MKAGKNTKDFRGDCTKELADLDARLAIEKGPDVHQALLVSKLYHLQLAKIDPPPPFLDLIQQDVPPTASVWSLEPSLILQLADEQAPGWGPYVMQARAKHPDPAIRSLLLFEYLLGPPGCQRRGRLEGRLQHPADGIHRHDRQAKKAKEILDSAQKTAIGHAAPAFSVTALGDAKTSYTLDTFKGRYLLIDFWATWCPPCRAEMPGLHAAWARFKGRPFDILSLSFDRRVEHIAPFRAQAATPMPWKHAFLEGGFQNPLSEAYGVKGIPKPLLIGPDGRIVASGNDLRGRSWNPR